MRWWEAKEQNILHETPNNTHPNVDMDASVCQKALHKRCWGLPCPSFHDCLNRYPSNDEEDVASSLMSWALAMEMSEVIINTTHLEIEVLGSW